MTENLSTQWRAFLTQWSAEVVASPFAAALPATLVQARWLGFAGASETQLAAAEKRLKTRLPSTYRAFLGVTDGWRLTAFPVERLHLPIWLNGEVDRLWSATSIAWARKRHKDLINVWFDNGGEDDEEDDEEYFALDPMLRDPRAAPHSHLKAALDIGTFEDGLLLLNPKRMTADGEWEAWYWNAELLGAIRYRSFWHLMQHLYEQFSTGISETQ
jgi:hypothetical protein